MSFTLAALFFGRPGTAMLGEFGVLSAIMLTMLGLGLHLYRHGHRISMEERVKDNKMSETAARKQIQFYGVCAPMLTVVGAVLLVLVIFEMAG